jgi:hypothetical protein
MAGFVPPPQERAREELASGLQRVFHRAVVGKSRRWMIFADFVIGGDPARFTSGYS